MSNYENATTSADEPLQPRRRLPWLVCGLLVLCPIVALNLVGRTFVDAEIIAGPPTTLSTELVQSRQSAVGWPWTYMRTKRERWLPLFYRQDGVEWISAPAVVGNAHVAFAAALIGGKLLARRFASRRKWWQFALFDLVAGMTVAAAALGWWYLPAQRNRQEARVLSRLGPRHVWNQRTGSREVPRNVIWQPGPTDWLSEFTDDPWLPQTARIVAMETYDDRMREITNIRGVRVLRITGETTDLEINLLDQLPSLEILDISNVAVRQDHGGWLDPPAYRLDYALRLPRLKRLFCQGNVLQGSDLADFAALEELHLAGSVLDDESIQAIARLKSLRILDLAGTKLDDRWLTGLSGLEHLELLDVRGTAVTALGLAQFEDLCPNCFVKR